MTTFYPSKYSELQIKTKMPYFAWSMLEKQNNGAIGSHLLGKSESFQLEYAPHSSTLKNTF